MEGIGEKRVTDPQAEIERLYKELAALGQQLKTLKADGKENSDEAKKLASAALVKTVEMQANMIKDLYMKFLGLDATVQQSQTMMANLLGFNKAGIISPGSKRSQ